MLLAVLGAFAQDITGQWNGMLDIYGSKLRLVIHITQGDNGLTATFDSPDQGAFGIPADSVSFENNTLRVSVESLKASISGEYVDGKIDAVFRQAWLELPLELTREEIAAPVVNRPQHPVEPYPYLSQDVSFENEREGITLRGTFTIPDEDGMYPAVVLVSGSGPQDRNEELMGHKPFLVIADYLTRAGIAVLRYDDRGTAESEGDFSTATTHDLMQDALSAVAWLKEHPQVSMIGMIGHSEGGIIAPMAAATDDDIDFIILLAGTGIPGDQLLELQGGLILRAMGTPEEDVLRTLAFNRRVYDLILNSQDDSQLRGKLDDLVAEAYADPDFTTFEGFSLEESQASVAGQLLGPWMLSFLRLDPRVALRQVRVPVLALNGSKDLQVPATENLLGIMDALAEGGNTQGKAIVYRNLNHLFQHSETGSPSEYGSIEETFAEEVLRDIVKWIQWL